MPQGDIELPAADPAHTILEPLTGIDKSVKAMAWDVYQTADQPTFEKRLGALPIPKDVKAKLWDAKFGQKPPAPVAAKSRVTDPRLKPSDATKPSRISALPTNLGRETFPLAGMMVGAAEGAEMGAPAGPVGAFVGGLAGAGVGAFGGEGFELSLEALAKRMGYPFNTTKKGAVSRLGEAANTGMVAEATGQAGTAALGKVAAPFKASLEPYAQESLSTFKTPAGKTAISPAEVSKSRILNFLRNWSERSIFGAGGPQEERQKIAENRVLSVLDDLAAPATAREAGAGVQGALPTDPAASAERSLSQATEAQAKGKVARSAAQEELRSELSTQGAARTRELVGKLPSATSESAGQAVRTARAAAIRTFRGQEREAWKAFEEGTESIPVDTSRLDTFVERVPIEGRGRILPDAGVTAAQRIAKATGGAEEDVRSALSGEVQVRGRKVIGESGKRLPSKLEEVFKSLGVGEEGEEGPITVKQFQKTVSDLNRLQRNLEQSAKFDPSKYNAQLGLVKKLNELAHADLEETLTKLSSVEQGGEITPGSPLDLYRKATTLTRLGNEQLFNREVAGVVRQAPEKVTQTLLRPNNSTAIKMTTQAVGDEAMGPVRRVALDHILTPDPTTKQIPWKKVLQRMSTLGDDTLGALFPKGEAEGVRRIATSILDSERLAAQQAAVQTRAELSAVTEARAAVKAAKQADPFATYRKVSPEKITSMLFRKDNVTAVDAMKTLVGPEGFKPVQRVAMDRVLAPNPETGEIDWKAVVSRLNSIDKDTLQAFFPGPHAAEIKRVATLMVKLAKPPTQASSSAIMLGQMGIIIGALSGTISPKLAPIVLTPQVLSRIFASETGLKWLSMGLELPPWSQAAVRASAQLAVFLHQESQNEREQKTQQSQQTPAAVAR